MDGMAIDPATAGGAGASGTHPLDTDALRKAIPGFVTKLYRMVCEPDQDMLKWNEDGSAFLVAEPDAFAKHMLPRYFKHNNFSSFVRQLNMYGFHKVPQVATELLQQKAESGPHCTSHWEFSHPYFKRDRFDLLVQVKRKVGKEEGLEERGPAASTGLTQESILAQLQELRDREEGLRTDIATVQRENQMLWTEAMSARERHLQQQQVIEKILRFLASVFISDKNINPTAAASQLNRAKRQLLLEDVPSLLSTKDSNSNIFNPTCTSKDYAKALRSDRSLWGAPPEYQSEQQQRIFNFIDTTNEMGNDIDELQRRLDLGTFDEYLQGSGAPQGSASSSLIPSPKKRKSSPVEEDFDISNFLMDDIVE